MNKYIKENGEVIEVTPKNGKTFTLEELQGYVHGYIQMVPVVGGKYVICDEDGKFKDYGINLKASEMYGDQICLGDFFVGDILVVDRDCVE